MSAKHNDRSIDLAFTSFLRYLVGKKLQIEQVQRYSITRYPSRIGNVIIWQVVHISLVTWQEFSVLSGIFSLSLLAENSLFFYFRNCKSYVSSDGVPYPNRKCYYLTGENCLRETCLTRNNVLNTLHISRFNWLPLIAYKSIKWFRKYARFSRL